MKQVVFLLLCVVAARIPTAQAATPSGPGHEVLAQAVQRFIAEESCWAYTQVIRRLDKNEGETVATYDPSKPLPERWSLLKWKGRTPSAAESAKWTKRRQNDAQQREGRSFVDLLDVSRATLVREDGDRAHFEVPLKKELIKNLVPTDKFVAQVGVSRSRQAVEEFSMRTTSPFRIAGIGEVSWAEGDVVFTRVHGEEAPLPALVRTSGAGKAFFVKVDRKVEISFLDHRRVAPAKN